MTFSVLRLGETIKWKEFSLRSLLYIGSSLISGAIMGFIISLLIYFISYLIPYEIKLVLLIIVTALYLLHEFKLINLRVPQNSWQVPENWVSYDDKQSMLVWGSILGAGIFTYIPHATFYILYLYIGFFLSPVYGLLFGALYALSRSLPSIVLSGLRNLGRKNNESCKMPKKYQPKINGFILSILLIYLLT